MKVNEAATVFTIKIATINLAVSRSLINFRRRENALPPAICREFGLSTLYAITYSAESDFEQAVIDHTALTIT